LGEALRRSCARHAGKPAMLIPEGSSRRALSYAEFYERVRGYAGALGGLGVRRGDRVVIHSENCAEWAFADWACQTLGAIVTPIYPTLPADQVQYIVADCGAKLVLSGSSELAGRVSGVSVALLTGSSDSVAGRATGSGLSLEEFEAGISATGPEDVATIVYTSGTTGTPKGAVLTHGGFTFLCEAVRHSIPIDETDTFLSFLPMSHIFERMAGQFLPIALGSTIAYSKGLASLAREMVEVRPTVMLCVPRFLEATQGRILDAMRKESGLKRFLFEATLRAGSRRFHGQASMFYGLLDSLVGAKVRARTGGRIRFFVSGGAALPEAVEEFYFSFGLLVLQGYGLTETSAGTCINHPDRNMPGTVGEPVDGMELKIAEDGEVLIRGPGVMREYWHLPEDTAAAIDAEGWFHSGDIGEKREGRLKITDRKKDLIVLSNGKNVAPQPIEGKLRASRLIAEAVVLGDRMDGCVALIVPEFEALRQAAGMAESEPVSGSEAAWAVVKAEIDRVNKGLANFEAVKRFALLDAGFSVDTGELTPTLKVKRKVVSEKYADVIRKLAEG